MPDFRDPIRDRPAGPNMAGTLMAVVTLVASVLPAWRAAAVDPMAALREE
jgi:hypothetical protein